MASWDDVAWTAYAQPWNKPPDTVPRLLDRLAALGRDGRAEDLRSPVLFALGNDHAGTYYPLAVPAVRCLAEVLQDGNETTRWQTLDLLADLLGSFDPDPDVVPSASEQRALQAALQDAGASLRPIVEAIAGNTGSPPRLQEAARELLAVLQRKGTG